MRFGKREYKRAPMRFGKRDSSEMPDPRLRMNLDALMNGEHAWNNDYGSDQ